jgi:hypothetical protein
MMKLLLTHVPQACQQPDQMPSPELTRLANVVATPHIGGLTPPASESEGLDPTRLNMLRRSRDLFATYVSDEEVGDYHVTESGWYAVDDGERVVLGPFTSLAECERAIRDRLNPPS